MGDFGSLWDRVVGAVRVRGAVAVVNYAAEPERRGVVKHQDLFLEVERQEVGAEMDWQGSLEIWLLDLHPEAVE